LTDEEVIRGLTLVVRSGGFIPVLVSAASTETGVFKLLDAIVDLLPSPADANKVIAVGKNGEETLEAKDDGPLAIYVWKTTADPFVGNRLSSAFIPVFAKLVRKNKQDAWDLAARVVNIGVVIFLFAAVGLIIFAQPLYGLIAPGFSLAEQERIVGLTKILFAAQGFL